MSSSTEQFHSLSFKPVSRGTWTGEVTRRPDSDDKYYIPKDCDIVLINPYIPTGSQNPKINAIINITFPTSIGFIAGYLQANGFERTEIIDEQLYPLSDDDLRVLVDSMRRPAVIGISSLTLNASRSYELIKKIKALDPTIKIVIGGIHPTVIPDEPFRRSPVDYSVRGEGEIPMLELCKVIFGQSDRAIETIGGVISRSADGSPLIGPAADLVENLDTIPPFPYELFERDLHKYPGFSGVFGSRGCPYACTFCSARSMSGLKYRYHSIERLISEFERLVYKYKQESIFFMDDNIGVHRPHFMKMCEAIIAAGLHKKAFFHGSMRGDNATDKMLDLARDANFKIIYFGLETGSERLMKEIKKGETVAQVADAIKRTAARGMSVGATIIFGLPGETHEDRLESVKFVRELPLASCRFNTLTPYPGTEDYQKAKAERRLLIKGDWENFAVQYMWESDDIPYVPENTSRDQLMFDTMWANLAYYLCWTGIKKLFSAKYAGGNVIKLKNRWYFNPSEVKKFYDVSTLLLSRFIGVSARLLWEKITGSTRDKHLESIEKYKADLAAMAVEAPPTAAGRSGMRPAWAADKAKAVPVVAAPVAAAVSLIQIQRPTQ